jgi:hypothetical protein
VPIRAQEAKGSIMNKYLFEVFTAVEVTADSEDEAYELLLTDDEEACVTIDSRIEAISMESID